jgi:hypothetical protein
VTYVAIGAWSASYRAPQFVRIGFDKVTYAVTGFDLESRCLNHSKSGDLATIEFVGSRACYNFHEPRVFKGIYIDEFEGQRFIEGAMPAARYKPKDKVWLEIDERSDLSAAHQFTSRKKKGTAIWLIEFEGQKAIRTRGGGFGHFGMSEDLVIVDKVLSAQLVYEQPGYLSEDVLVR